MQIYFVRHGETEYNKLKIVQGSGVDSSLNETGIAQADAFFQQYKDISFDIVFTSNLKRTMETAGPFLKKNIPHIAVENLNEIGWGIHEGKTSDMAGVKAYKDLINKWRSGDFDARLEGGESAGELRDRLIEFLEHLKTRKEETVLVYTHGRTLRCLMCLIDGNHLREMENYSHHNTCLFLVKWDNDQYEVLKRNDTTHLENLKVK